MLRHLSSGRLSLACVQVSSLPNMVIKDEIGEHVSSFERLFIFGGQMCFWEISRSVDTRDLFNAEDFAGFQFDFIIVLGFYTYCVEYLMWLLMLMSELLHMASWHLLPVYYRFKVLLLKQKQPKVNHLWELIMLQQVRLPIGGDWFFLVTASDSYKWTSLWLRDFWQSVSKLVRVKLEMLHVLQNHT